MKFIVVVAAFFLSSHAEASRADVTKPLTVFDIGGRRSLIGASDRFATLVYTPTRTAFETPQPPVRYVVEWPRLPSVAEVAIKVAEGKLVEYVAERAQKAEEKRKAVDLHLDWDGFQKALGLAMILAGVFLSVFYGKFKLPPKRSP